ncbi:cation:proton antiporter family protein [Alteromonas sp. a30]|uniref:cation:proton antiporter family protein n=1 Tax=Alteromonas sp. a30 TaxID=2730917 RepID=UPI00228074F5|nr:cation:proton antiporter family protein [Alteromonas sp. a30]MCY7295130.1 cation:proton antiporter [Alteromonas sp. a30]
MEFIWVLVAFVCGFAFKFLSLPPLIGFLCAGFILNFYGVKPTDNLNMLADLGITLMLFTIGLKLKVKDLFRAEVWVGTGLSSAFWIALFAGFSMLYMMMGLAYFSVLEWKTATLLGFALSFSSTVCIVKVLEDSGEMKTRHGKLAIAILVMQDIIAVIFLASATGKLPSVWALGLPLLLFVRPLLNKLIVFAGHGELLPLTGFFLALGGYELFTLVDMKGDLGALILGIVLSSHPKSTELAKSLLGFKDLFLIGFFLSIGFITIPTWSMFAMALFICALIPIKYVLFFSLFSALKLRARTSYLSGLLLSNFSEFGLIVVSLSVAQGWLQKDWLVILAISVSLSFVFTSIAYRFVHRYYTQLKPFLIRFERKERLPEDAYVEPGKASVLVVGMGRVGKGSFDALTTALGSGVIGMDADSERVGRLRDAGKNVIYGDAEDADLWERTDISALQLILLALPSIEDIDNICQQLRDAGYKGKLAAMARFEDERKHLINSGIDKVFNFYTEVGAGFAEESLAVLQDIKKEAKLQSANA